MKVVKNMRIKIIGKIVSKTDLNKTNYSHGIYSMILNVLKPKTSERIHNPNTKEYRLFTFSNIFIKNENFHVYISGEDNLITEMIEGLEKNSMVRIDDMIMVVSKILLCPTLPTKEKYLFKGRVITTEPIDGKKSLIENDTKINERLKQNALGKLKEMNITGDINFEVLKKSKRVSKYKDNIHHNSWDCLILVSGDYEAIKSIYEVGAGENTATGHGLLWEV